MIHHQEQSDERAHAMTHHQELRKPSVAASPGRPPCAAAGALLALIMLACVPLWAAVAEPGGDPAGAKDIPISKLPVSKPYTGPLAKYDPDCELALGEVVPEFPDKPLRRYLYINLQDSSQGNYAKGIIVLDIDDNLRFVKRIGSPLMRKGPSASNSLTGVRWQSGSAVNDRLYYSYRKAWAAKQYLPPDASPQDGSFLLGCIDLRSDKTLWEKIARVGSVEMLPDGQHLIGTGFKGGHPDRCLWILDAATGREVKRVPTVGKCWFYHTIGRSHTWLNIGSEVKPGRQSEFYNMRTQQALTAQDYLTMRGLSEANVKTVLKLRAKPLITYHPNGKEDIYIAQDRSSGSLAIHLGSNSVVPMDPGHTVLHNACDPNASVHRLVKAGASSGFQWSADERRVYVGCHYGHLPRIRIWDTTAWPPRFVGVMGEGLSSKRMQDPVTGLMVGVNNKGSSYTVGEGSIVCSCDSWYFDAKTWKPMGMMRDENGKVIRCTKGNEVYFRGHDVVYVGQRYNAGRYTHPERIFPRSSDTSPPTAIAGLKGSVGDLKARWANGNVVASVTLTWSPATDDEGVQRYAVYRDGDLIGNCLGVNPDIDPVMSPEDQAEYERQVGKFRPNTFVARYLEPSKTYRFEVEPLDFAQNRGPRTAVEVAVPAVEDATAERLVRTWAETVIAKVKENPKTGRAFGGLVSGLKPLVDRPWARAVLKEVRDLPGKRVDWRVRREVRDLLKGNDPE